MRKKEVKKRLDDLKNDKLAAEIRYRELEKRLKELEIKKEKIIEQFKAEGLAEREKIIAEARQRATQILDQADLTIQNEIHAVKDSLRKKLFDSAAQKSREIVTEETEDCGHGPLINEFAERVGKLH